MLRLLSSLMEEIKDAGKKEESDMSSQQVQTTLHLFFIKLHLLFTDSSLASRSFSIFDGLVGRWNN